jgi:quinol monooxygenase YgiN
MYGTVARVRVQEAYADHFLENMNEIQVGRAPGQVAVYVYQMDKNSREYYLVAMFENKESYFANANSPEQGERFTKMMEMLEAEPEWHDGEIVYAVT